MISPLHNPDHANPHHVGTPWAPDKRQDADGTPFVAYYIESEMLSFVWDGFNEEVQVCWGGAAEPVVALIPAPTYENITATGLATDDILSSWLERLQKVCTAYAASDDWKLLKSELESGPHPEAD